MKLQTEKVVFVVQREWKNIYNFLNKFVTIFIIIRDLKCQAKEPPGTTDFLKVLESRVTNSS